MSDQFAAIREHLEKHAGKERATFSIIGIKALLEAVDKLGASQGWIVGSGDEKRWRCWNAGGPDWTEDREEATRYARRVDAEAVHADDEDAWTVVPYESAWKPTHQHLKRRSLYRFIGNATLQASISLRDMDAMVVYQAEDGSLWVRPDVEFFDGRFLTLAGGAG